MVLARMQLNDYTNKVLNIVKIKFDLKDKSEALNKFVEEYGNDILDREVKEEYVKEILSIDNNHMKKYGCKSMKEQELDEIFEVK